MQRMSFDKAVQGMKFVCSATVLAKALRNKSLYCGDPQPVQTYPLSLGPVSGHTFQRSTGPTGEYLQG